MQFERNRRNGGTHFFSNEFVGGDFIGKESDSAASSSLLMPAAISPPSRLNYIEHRVSKMDTLAGVAIKYGVEVADIKRMNGLVTDLQMFAHKSLQIPLPGRHPPSPILANGSADSGEHANTQLPHIDLLGSFQSLKLKASQAKVSPSPPRISAAMSSLQGYYGLTPQKNKGRAEGTEMTTYRTGGARYLEDADQPPTRHRKTRSNDFLQDNSEFSLEIPISDAENNGYNDKSGGIDCRTPEMVLKDDASNIFSGMKGKGLALRPKSASRTSLPQDTDSSRLNPIPMGDSIADSFSAFRKSSSTSNLQESDNGSSIWATPKWAAKFDTQPRTTGTMSSGLPKPLNGRRNKAALD